jgi:hypothetical protein
MRSMDIDIRLDGNRRHGRHHLMLLGPVFFACLTCWSVEVPQAATASIPGKAPVIAADPQPAQYWEGHQKGYAEGLEAAKQYNCLRSPAWRPRAWWERAGGSDPGAVASNVGYFDGSEAAYDKVCGVNRTQEKAQIP